MKFIINKKGFAGVGAGTIMERLAFFIFVIVQSVNGMCRHCNINFQNKMPETDITKSSSKHPCGYQFGTYNFKPPIFI